MGIVVVVVEVEVDEIVEEVVVGKIDFGVVIEACLVAEDICLCVEEDVDVIVAVVAVGVGGDVCSVVSPDSVTIAVEGVFGEIDVEREGVSLVVVVAFKELVRVIVNVEFVVVSVVVSAEVFVGISVVVEF